MRRSTRNFLGLVALASAWAFLLDDETRQALVKPASKRDVIDVEAKP